MMLVNLMALKHLLFQLPMHLEVRTPSWLSHILLSELSVHLWLLDSLLERSYQIKIIKIKLDENNIKQQYLFLIGLLTSLMFLLNPNIFFHRIFDQELGILSSEPWNRKIINVSLNIHCIFRYHWVFTTFVFPQKYVHTNQVLQIQHNLLLVTSNAFPIMLLIHGVHRHVSIMIIFNEVVGKCLFINFNTILRIDILKFICEFIVVVNFTTYKESLDILLNPKGILFHLRYEL